MPAEMLVTPNAATTANTETWGEGLSTTESSTKTTSGTLSKVHNSYEVSNGGSNANFENSEFSMLCSNCMRLHTECECAQFVQSNLLRPADLPNPNDSIVASDYVLITKIIERVPEMVPVNKAYYRKEVGYEQRTVSVAKSRIVEDEVEHTELVPVVKMVPKTRTEICYKVTKEEMDRRAPRGRSREVYFPGRLQFDLQGQLPSSWVRAHS